MTHSTYIVSVAAAVDPVSQSIRSQGIDLAVPNYSNLSKTGVNLI